MLDPSDRTVLLRWCRARHVTWSALSGPPEHPVITLLADVGPWSALHLTHDAAGWLLATPEGETLAAASSLPALLDAMDAGIAETIPTGHAQPSLPTPNTVGSAIT